MPYLPIESTVPYDVIPYNVIPFTHIWRDTRKEEEVGHDVGLTQYHMTSECSLEQFLGVAFLVAGAQPALAMKKSALFCLTCVYSCR